jgi:hypothetical protein
MMMNTPSAPVPRNPSFGGLSPALVMSRSLEKLELLKDAMLQDTTLHQYWERNDWDDATAQEALDTLLVDHEWWFGTNRLWRQVFVVDDDAISDADVAEILSFYPKSANIVHALLREMTESWAPPVQADADASPVKMTDFAAMHRASQLIGKGQEPDLMAFLGALNRQSPKQAAMALGFAQHVTLDFYAEHAADPNQ